MVLLKKTRGFAVLLLTALLAWCCCSNGVSAKSGTSGEVRPTESYTPGKSSTDITAGVVVDYMGKLKFIVRDEETAKPVEGASVELYVPELGRYVLFGQSGTDGIYQLDVAYGTGTDAQKQYLQGESKSGEKGTLAEFENNQIRWKVYKKDYLPYPAEGEVLLDAITLPYEIEVSLYKEPRETDETKATEEPGDTDDTDDTEGTEPTESNKTTETTKTPVTYPPGNNNPPHSGQIPKTGVEQAIGYGVIGLGFCVAAILLIILYLYRKKENEKK